MLQAEGRCGVSTWEMEVGTVFFAFLRLWPKWIEMEGAGGRTMISQELGQRVRTDSCQQDQACRLPQERGGSGRREVMQAQTLEMALAETMPGGFGGNICILPLTGWLCPCPADWVGAWQNREATPRATCRQLLPTQHQERESRHHPHHCPLGHPLLLLTPTQ